MRTILASGDFSLYRLRGANAFPLPFCWYQDGIYLAGFVNEAAAIQWAKREKIIPADYCASEL